MPSPKTYENVLERRIKAKKAGDKATANALKLIANTTYGATLNRYNNLYDPLMARSVCISGQLFLLELLCHIVKDIPDVIPININTDGLMISFDDQYYDQVIAITKEWEQRTGFELEEDKIKAIYQKDVNGYIEIPMEGKPKIKGGYLVRGIAAAGAFNVNNNAVCVAKAIKEYFVNGTDPEEYINGIDDPFKFQMVAKAGAKYKEAYWLVNNEKVPVQKVNRVYAAKDQMYGKLFKVKAENDSQAKIDSLPEHCIIDNSNAISIEEIDKCFYIDLARKRINDFKGIKPEKKGKSMATAKDAPTKANVHQKLILARQKFLDERIQKSGKNMQLQFKYYELDDIVPKATRIFREVGLISVTNFCDDIATMTVINCDAADEKIDFELPFTQIEPIVSNAGKQVTNPLQALGSSVTYLRRYLWMLVLDVTEPDEIEESLGTPATLPPTPLNQNEPVATAPVPTPVAAAPAKPKTDAERKSTTVKLAAADGNASELQLKQLTNALTELLTKKPETKPMVQELQIKTKNFTEVSKKECEGLLTKISEMMNAPADPIVLEDSPFD